MKQQIHVIINFEKPLLAIETLNIVTVHCTENTDSSEACNLKKEMNKIFQGLGTFREYTIPLKEGA